MDKGYEVLLLDDAIDEYTIFTLEKYKDFKLVNIGKSGFTLPLSDDEKELEKKIQRMYQPLVTWMQSLLGSEVERINIKQHSLKDPMVALGTESGYSANMEKILKS